MSPGHHEGKWAPRHYSEEKKWPYLVESTSPENRSKQRGANINILTPGLG